MKSETTFYGLLCVECRRNCINFEIKKSGRSKVFGIISEGAVNI